VGSTGTTTATVKVPAGVQNGDLLLAFFSYYSADTASAPAGWTLLHSATSNDSGVEAVWYRFAKSNPPGSTFTWTFERDVPYEAGGMLAYRGVAASFQDGFCTDQGNNNAPTLCGFSTSHSNDIYLGFFSAGNTNLVLPGDLTALQVNQYVNGSHFGVAAADKSLGAPGVVPADVGTMNSGGWATVVFALKGN
jgi:hypothetical protein